MRARLEEKLGETLRNVRVSRLMKRRPPPARQPQQETPAGAEPEGISPDDLAAMEAMLPKE